MNTEVRLNARPDADGASADLRCPPLLLIVNVPGEGRREDVVARASALAHDLARRIGQLRGKCSSIHVVIDGDPVLRTTLSLGWRTIASTNCRSFTVRIHASVADAIAEFMGDDGGACQSADPGRKVPA